MTEPDAPSGAAGDARARPRPGAPSGRALRRGAGLLALALLVILVVLGADRPADPYLVGHGGQPDVMTFGEIAFRIEGGQAAGGETAIRCAFLADTVAQQRVGLMHRTDLAGHDGMLFRFPDDTLTTFHMAGTPLPLTIAWFDSGGNFVSAADMIPCLNQGSCPKYSAAKPYRYALEVPQGQLAALGIGLDTRLVVGGRCP